MQHDTSPHIINLGGKQRRVQTASLVLCYSRMVFFQFYPNFTRFHCKVFLTDALHYLGGGCTTCMIDNTHLVVLQGTGREMVPVPEMQAFGERYHFTFKAHEKGDANRSAHVERRFSYIENNFLAGRAFQESLASPPQPSFEESLRTDIEVLGSVARRAHRRLRQGALQNLLEREREELARSLRQSLEETRCMAERFEQEMGHAGPQHASGDSQAA